MPPFAHARDGCLLILPAIFNQIVRTSQSAPLHPRSPPLLMLGCNSAYCLLPPADCCLRCNIEYVTALLVRRGRLCERLQDSKAASTLSRAQLQQRFCPPPPYLLLLFILTYTSLDLQHSGSSITFSAFCRNASKTHRCLERGCALGNRRTGPCGHCLCGESLGLTIFRAWTCYCATPPLFPDNSSTITSHAGIRGSSLQPRSLRCQQQKGRQWGPLWSIILQVAPLEDGGAAGHPSRACDGSFSEALVRGGAAAVHVGEEL